MTFHNYNMTNNDIFIIYNESYMEINQINEYIHN
jgi:hypothetical protein